MLQEPTGSNVLRFEIDPAWDENKDKFFASKLIAREVIHRLR